MVSDEATSIERYKFYVEESIKGGVIIPIKSEWIDNVFKKLPPPPPILSNEVVQRKLNELNEEMKTDYNISVAQGMINYILLSKSEKERLNITALPAELTSCSWGWQNNDSGKKFSLLLLFVIIMS